jgi:diphosphomevalonate decarboxylase
MNEKLTKIKSFIKDRKFSEFGRLIEDEALNMHAICLTSTPPLIYWEPTTIEIMKLVIYWREKGEVESYFTIDAGPSVHIICQKKDSEIIENKLGRISGVKRVVVNSPAPGAKLTEKHLF